MSYKRNRQTRRNNIIRLKPLLTIILAIATAILLVTTITDFVRQPEPVKKSVSLIDHPIEVQKPPHRPRVIIKTKIVRVPGPVKTVYVSRSTTRQPLENVYPTLSTNQYKLYIYNHESGNDPKRYNSSGCVGLGQACPGSKLLAVCPTLSYSCEDAWFTNYAMSRYGSWENAYKFWIANRWW